jgi:alpha-L-fucosidase
MRLDGSPTHLYHRDHYGATYDHHNFAALFDKEIQNWNPDTWAKVFSDAGAKYVVLPNKHHDGFTLRPPRPIQAVLWSGITPMR